MIWFDVITSCEHEKKIYFELCTMYIHNNVWVKAKKQYRHIYSYYVEGLIFIQDYIAVSFE